MIVTIVLFLFNTLLSRGEEALRVLNVSALIGVSIDLIREATFNEFIFLFGIVFSIFIESVCVSCSLSTFNFCGLISSCEYIVNGRKLTISFCLLYLHLLKHSFL